MMVPEPECLLQNLDYRTYRKLRELLSENDAWKKVAEELRFSTCKVTELEKSTSPASQFLMTLEQKLCTVSFLTKLLSRCNLVEVLALLTPRKPICIEKQPGEDDGDDVYVGYGGQLRLEVVVSGNPVPQYVWLHHNKELTDQTSSVLLKEDFTEEDEGEYSCIVTQEDSDGEVEEIATRSVEVKLLPEPIEIIQQPHNIQCHLGESIVLLCSCNGIPPPVYQWYRGNTALTGENSNTLIINNATLFDGGEYKCYISNGYNDAHSDTATVKVFPHPMDEVPCVQKPPSPVSEKVALLIANESYDYMKNLKTAMNDVITLSEILSNLGFKVLCFCDLTLSEMKSAVQKICEVIPEDALVVFYYAGHGFELHHKCLLPVDAPAKYDFEDCLCEEEIHQEILKKNPRLLLFILDMCLTIPKEEENPSIHRAQVPIYEVERKRNFIPVYSTTSYLAAYERDSETNGIYMQHLKKVLSKNVPITTILDETHKSLYDEDPKAAEKQIPSYVNCLPFHYYLTNPSTGNRKTTEFFTMCNSTDDPKWIYFHHIRKRSLVTFQKFKNCFNNVLEVRMKDLTKWAVEVQIPCKNLPLHFDRDGKDCILKISGLQKLKMELTLTILLKEDQTLVDNYLLEFTNAPLIVPAQLWYSRCDEASNEL